MCPPSSQKRSSATTSRSASSGASRRPEATAARRFVVVEQRVAPVERGAERLLAIQRGTAAGAEHVERGPEALGELGGGEVADARGRQLDRQRHPVQAPADRGSSGQVVLAELQ